MIISLTAKWQTWLRILVMVLGWLVASPVHATTGIMKIPANTVKKLTEDHRGTVRFDGDNSTLNCQGHAIRFSATSGTACAGESGRCGIVATGRKQITVKNCDLTGA